MLVVRVGARRGGPSIIAPAQMAAIGLAMPLPAMSGAEPWIGSNIDGVVRSGLMLPPGRHAEAAGDGRADVGEDVAEQVRGDDHVERLRVRDHPRAQRVHVVLLQLDVRETPSRRSATTSSHSTIACCSAFDLVALASIFRGRDCASLNA